MTGFASPHPATPDERDPPRKWLLVGLLATAGVINYLDRSVLAVAAPAISAEFGFSAHELGWVFSSFFLGYVVSCLVGGLAVDRFGAKLVLGAAMTLWSIFCGMTAFVVGFWSMAIFRLLFGLGEGPFNASINKAVNDWFPPGQRATLLGIIIAGQPLGGALAGPVAGLFTAHFGWRAAFVVVCVIGLAWTILWSLLVRSQKGRTTAAKAGEDAGSPVPTVRTLIRGRSVIGVTFAFFSFSYVIFFFSSWFPSYLIKRFEFGLATMSWLTVVPWLLGFAGLICGGLLADLLGRILGRALLGRKVVLVGGLAIGGICVALAGLAATPAVAIACMSLGLFAVYATGPSYWATLQEIVPSTRLGGVGGFMAMMATTSGILAPALTGYLLQASNSFASSFAVAGMFAFGGAGAAALLIRTRGFSTSAPGPAATILD